MAEIMAEQDDSSFSSDSSTFDSEDAKEIER